LRPGGLARHAGGKRPGGDVVRQRGQWRVGPCGERLARPHVKLVFGQPTLHERDLKQVDHVLAVGVSRPEMPAA
jgi:hypothetical protein